MENIYTALGLMSGTSMDGVDASIISSIDGIQYDEEFNRYYEYDKGLYQKISSLRDNIFTSKDLKRLSKELKSLEKEITLFHAKVANEVNHSVKKSNIKIPEIIGFHGQTMFHNPDEKISVQLGDGKLLSQLTKKTVVYDFRQNDLKNGGQGAPLTPIFHQSIKNYINKEVELPIIFINIGGISNATCFYNHQETGSKMFAGDIGPGNCLIDDWIRKNSKKKYDKDGLIARSGKKNRLILNKGLDNFQFYNKGSLDIKNFDISFAKGLSIEDGASTLTEFTAELIHGGLNDLLHKNKQDWKNPQEIIICGGGRKNKYLMELLNLNLLCKNFSTIDEYNIDGDFIESQAFAFLAIRSILNLPISFPETTGCNKPCTGGVVVKNY
tara:strand:- start:685 stop:1833 length:1149 start_codon:yes stop_codon:yes gene_type:complete